MMPYGHTRPEPILTTLFRGTGLCHCTYTCEISQLRIKLYVSPHELTNCYFFPLSWCISSLKKSIDFCPGVYTDLPRLFTGPPHTIPDGKVHGANMGPIWGRQDTGGPHVCPMNFAVWDAAAKSIVFEILKYAPTVCIYKHHQTSFINHKLIQLKFASSGGIINQRMFVILILSLSTVDYF